MQNSPSGKRAFGVSGSSGAPAAFIDPSTSIPAFFLFLVLFAANAFFVAAEFALIAVRRGRLEQEARDGDPQAARALPLLGRAEELALAAQLGSSASTVSIGVMLARAIRDTLGAVTAGTAAPPWGWLASTSPLLVIVLAIAAAVALHVVLGEQVPKIVGIQRAEWLIRYVLLRPLWVVALLLRPFVAFFSLVIGAVSRILHLAPVGFHPLAHTPEEIRMLVVESHERGVVEQDEREMIHGVFEFTDTVAREVMTPRTDIVAVPLDVSLDELVRVLVEEGHSRLPVYDTTIDNVVGVLLAKDLLPLLWRQHGRWSEPFEVRSVMREPFFVPDTKPVDDILAELRQQRLHAAIVLDEFGGTSGLLTMEDLLEEIVGEINDEYDVEEPDFAHTPEGDVLIDGGASISEVNERFKLALPEADFDTIGGFIFGALGRVPAVGDIVEAPATTEEARLRVEEIEERRVTRVRLTRVAAVPERSETIEVEG